MGKMVRSGWFKLPLDWLAFGPLGFDRDGIDVGNDDENDRHGV